MSNKIGICYPRERLRHFRAFRVLGLVFPQALMSILVHQIDSERELLSLCVELYSSSIILLINSAIAACTSIDTMD